MNSNIVKMVMNFGLVLLIAQCFLLSVRCADAEEEKENIESSTEWNELIFTQLWGYSSCLQFKGETGGTCRYEDKPSIWSIHGIWPTEVGTFGPAFCSKVQFNKTEIESILDQLNIYWYEINEKKDGTYFWTHEWTKHGSCAKEVEEFSTELKYFQKGLELRNEFDLYSILKDGGIIPQASRGYLVSEISNVIEAAVGAKPYIQCLLTKESGGTVDHLLAVELCLDKNSLKPVDCKTKSKTHVNLSGVAPCPDEHMVQYTDHFTYSKTKTEL